MSTTERSVAHEESDVSRIPTQGDGSLNAPAEIINLGMGFMRAKVLLTAVRLGVFQTLIGRSLGLDELRANVGVHERGARDFFDSLVALGLLERERSEYRNAPAAEEFLDPDKPYQYIGGLLEEVDEQWYPTWGRLADSLGDGAPRWIANEQQEFYDEIYTNSERLREFHGAMVGAALLTARTLPDRFPWDQYGSVADIGCCGGALLAQLLSRHPHLTGIGYDLPAMEPLFAKTAADHGSGDRMRFLAGSFLTDPLPTADVHVFGHVLHNWGLDTKRMLLRKSYEALPAGGAIVIYDTLIDDDRRQHVTAMMASLQMLLATPEGYDYSGAECLPWLEEAGFREARIEPLAGPDFLIVAEK